MSQQKAKLFFPNLDGLRFIAFALVFSEHVIWGAVRLLDIKSPLLLHVLYTSLCNGKMGVSVFFVLSGFLITYLILSEIKLTGSIHVGSFYIRRFLRIWPLYYALLLFTFFIYPLVQSLMHAHPEPLGLDARYYYTFLGNFDMIRLAHENLPGSTLAGVTWSVAVEEQFYLIWPLLFFFLPENKYILIFCTFILASFFFRWFHHSDASLINFHSLGVCADLAIGGLAAYLSLNYKRFRSSFEFVSDRKRLLIYLSGILFVLLNGFYLRFEYMVLFDRFLPCLFFAWVILDQNFCKSERFKLSKWKWGSRWGKYTYGMYLLHQLAFLIVLNSLHFFNFEGNSFLAGMCKAAVTFALTCLISYISFHYFEKPFLKLKEKFAYFTKD
jgi:peptidoglycan/LPS O-acetylase OafA/YrhL